MSSSICPKGWRLPTGGSGGEFDELYAKYNSSAELTKVTGANIQFAGWNTGDHILQYQGTAGFHWAKTAFDKDTAYNLNINSSLVRIMGGFRYRGFSVR